MQCWKSFTMLLLVLLAGPYATSAAQNTPENDGNALLRKCTTALRSFETQQGEVVSLNCCDGQIGNDGHNR